MCIEACPLAACLPDLFIVKLTSICTIGILQKGPAHCADARRERRWSGVRGSDGAGCEAGLLQDACGYAGLCLTVPIHHDGPQPVLLHPPAARAVRVMHLTQTS